MKNVIGIIRKVDTLGRVVIPSELRRILGIEVDGHVEILKNEDEIIIRKYTHNHRCSITGEVADKLIPLMDGKLMVSNEGCRILLEEMRQKM